MLLDPTKTVRELAVALPNAARVFEKTKIDYCRKRPIVYPAGIVAHVDD